MNEKKHQQILKYDEKFIVHNMIRRSKIKKSIINQFDCCAVLFQSSFQEEFNRRNARIAAR